ncbi:MAG: hypothetical protein KDD62_07050, partial [Bdellovibrionales bacterium]|nr:hypothetical protein [Bdellovibrionales bacterium]
MLILDAKAPQASVDTAIAVPPVIGLEGLPYAGKSMLSAALQRLGIARLPELAELHASGLRFPKFSETSEDAAESLDWFVRAEVERYKSLEEFAPTV